MSVYPDNVLESDIEGKVMSDDEIEEWSKWKGAFAVICVTRDLSVAWNDMTANDELHFLTEAIDDAKGIVQQKMHALANGE